jgi:hypothetical protein
MSVTIRHRDKTAVLTTNGWVSFDQDFALMLNIWRDAARARYSPAFGRPDIFEARYAIEHLDGAEITEASEERLPDWAVP